MRLTCPNCDAQYDVSAEMIPAEGRDVQCSSCGHVWFQTPEDTDDGYTDAVWDAPPPSIETPLVEAEAAELTDLTAEVPPTDSLDDKSEDAPFLHAFDEDDVPAPVAAPPRPAGPQPTAAAVASAVATSKAPPEVSTDTASAAPEDLPFDAPDTPLATDEADALPRRKPLDEGMLSVLREEAERESRARAQEAARNAPRVPPIQPDLGLPDAEPPVRLRIRPRATPVEQVIPDPVPEDPAAQHGSRSPRRELLPDIEQINSTLEASSTGRGAQRAIPALETAALRKTGFRSGFFLVLALAVIGWMVYSQAPVLAEKMPQMADTLERYVGSVDAARLWVNETLRSLLPTG